MKESSGSGGSSGSGNGNESNSTIVCTNQERISLPRFYWFVGESSVLLVVQSAPSGQLQGFVKSVVAVPQAGGLQGKKLQLELLKNILCYYSIVFGKYEYIEPREITWRRTRHNVLFRITKMMRCETPLDSERRGGPRDARQQLAVPLLHGPEPPAV